MSGALMSTKQVAAAMGISERTAQRIIQTKRIPSLKIGGCRRVDPKDLERFLETRKAAERG